MAQEMTLKRGDSLVRKLNLTGSDGEAIAVDTIASQIRTLNGALVDTLTIAATNEVGIYDLSSDDTSDYPIGELKMDIEITINGIIKSSDDIQIIVIEDVTQ